MRGFAMGLAALVCACVMPAAPASAATPAGGTADVGLSVTFHAGVAVGNDTDFSIRAHNLGPDKARGVRARLRIPAGFEFSSATADCSLRTRVVVCEIGAIAPGHWDRAISEVWLHALTAGTVHVPVWVVAKKSSDPNPADNRYVVSIEIFTPPGAG